MTTMTTQSIDFGHVDLDDARLIRKALAQFVRDLEDYGDVGTPDLDLSLEEAAALLQRAGTFRAWVDTRIRIAERPAPTGAPDLATDPGAPAGTRRRGRRWRPNRQQLAAAAAELAAIRADRPTRAPWDDDEEPPVEVVQAARDAFRATIAPTILDGREAHDGGHDDDQGRIPPEVQEWIDGWDR